MNTFSRRLTTGLLLLLGGGQALAADISGVVRDQATARPIAGARVRLIAREGFFNVRIVVDTITGTDGRYRVNQPGFAGEAAIMADAAGSAARNQAGAPCTAPRDCFRTTAILNDAPSTVDFDLPAEARLSGRVVDADGGTSPGFGIVELRWSPADSANTFTTQTPVTPDGRFRFTGLHPGTYTLTARVRRSQNGPDAYPDTAWPERPCDNVTVWCVAVAGDAFVLAAGAEPTPLEVRVRRGAYVRTRVFSNGNGLVIPHTALLHAAADPARYTLSSSLGDENGYNYIGPVLPGAYKLLVEGWPGRGYQRVFYPDTPCPEYPCDFSTATTIDLASGQLLAADDMHLVPTRVLEGRVVEQGTGQPLAGVHVGAGNEFLMSEFSGTYWGFISNYWAYTGDDGRYHLEGIEHDELIVRTQHAQAGYVDIAWPARACEGLNVYCQAENATYDRLDMQARPVRDDIDFELPRGAAIRGRVEYPDGRPARRYAVAVIPVAANRIARPIRANNNGLFAVEGLSAEGHYLAASREPAARGTIVTVYPEVSCYIAAIADPPLCQLERGTVVTPAAGQAVENIRIVVPFDDAIFSDTFEP